MKKQIMQQFFVFALVLFVACGGDGNVGSNPLRDASKEVSLSERVTSGLENSPEPKLGESPSVTMVSSRTGIVDHAYAGNQEGCYQFIDQPDGTANLLYTDYASLQRIYLSSDVNFGHDDETDASWFGDTIGGLSPILAGDKLYVIKLGQPLFYDGTSDKTLGCIYQLDLNGANRKEIFTLSPQEMFVSAVAFDGTNFYTFISRDNVMDLCKINLSDGTREVLHSLKSDNKAFLMDAAERTLFIKVISLPETSDSTSPGDQFSSQIHTVYAFSLDSKKMEKCVEWVQGERCEAFKDGVLYSINVASETLEKRNLLRDENIESLDIDLSEFGKAPEIILHEDIFDMHAYLIAFGDTVSGRTIFSLDLATGKLSPVLLTVDEFPIKVVAENEDGFLVPLETRTVSFTDETPDGDKFEAEILITQLARMSKENYWNNSDIFVNVVDKF